MQLGWKHVLGCHPGNQAENPLGSKLGWTRRGWSETLCHSSPGFSGGATQLSGWSIREKSMVSEIQHNFSNMNWFDTKHTIMENLCLSESDVGNMALLRATEKQDYKGIWLIESLGSKCEFTQQISMVCWDKCVVVTSYPPPQEWDFPGSTGGREPACQCKR